MNEEKYQAILKKLAEPFPPDCIEWRVQSATEKNGKIKLLILPYIESRAVMERFDEVCGVFWKSDFQKIQVNNTEAFQCRLSIKIGDEWITRTDAAEISDYESVKGGHSNALKRAGVQWGVGRYLYALPKVWVEMKDRGKYPVYGSFKINGQTRQLNGYFDPPELPHWALPKGFSQKTQKDNQKPEQKASTNAGEEREKACFNPS